MCVWTLIPAMLQTRAHPATLLLVQATSPIMDKLALLCTMTPLFRAPPSARSGRGRLRRRGRSSSLCHSHLLLLLLATMFTRTFHQHQGLQFRHDALIEVPNLVLGWHCIQRHVRTSLRQPETSLSIQPANKGCRLIQGLDQECGIWDAGSNLISTLELSAPQPHTLQELFGVCCTAHRSKPLQQLLLFTSTTRLERFQQVVQNCC